MLALTDGPILLLVCCDLAAVGCGTHNRLIQLRIVRKRKTHLNGSFILTMPKMILESLTIKNRPFAERRIQSYYPYAISSNHSEAMWDRLEIRFA